MPSQKRYSLCPGIGKRQVHDLVSTQAYYTFELVDRHRDAAPFSFDEIELLSSKARRFHTGRLLKQCLAELVETSALSIEKKGRRKKKRGRGNDLVNEDGAVTLPHNSAPLP